MTVAVLTVAILPGCPASRARKSKLFRGYRRDLMLEKIILSQEGTINLSQKKIVCKSKTPQFYADQLAVSADISLRIIGLELKKLKNVKTLNTYCF